MNSNIETLNLDNLDIESLEVQLTKLTNIVANSKRITKGEYTMKSTHVYNALFKPGVTNVLKAEMPEELAKYIISKPDYTNHKAITGTPLYLLHYLQLSTNDIVIHKKIANWLSDNMETLTGFPITAAWVRMPEFITNSPFWNKFGDNIKVSSKKTKGMVQCNHTFQFITYASNTTTPLFVTNGSKTSLDEVLILAEAFAGIINNPNNQTATVFINMVKNTEFKRLFVCDGGVDNESSNQLSQHDYYNTMLVNDKTLTEMLADYKNIDNQPINVVYALAKIIADSKIGKEITNKPELVESNEGVDTLVENTDSEIISESENVGRKNKNRKNNN